MRRIPPLVLALFLGGCAPSPKSAQTPTVSPSPRQGDTIVLGTMDVMGEHAVRDVGPERRQALRRQIPQLQPYFVAVETAIRALPSPNPTSNMVAKDWRAWFNQQLKKERGPYSVTLWSYKQGTPYRTISCNVASIDQRVDTPIGPTIMIGKRSRDLRLDWFINTGDQKANETIKLIVLREAYKF